LQRELHAEQHGQQYAGRVRRLGQAEAEVDVQVVGCGLADRRAHDLDHPEVEGDLGNLVEHAPGGTEPGALRYCAHWICSSRECREELSAQAPEKYVTGARVQVTIRRGSWLTRVRPTSWLWPTRPRTARRFGRRSGRAPSA